MKDQIEKQAIEEMAKYLFEFAPILSESNCHYVAERAYKDGYRKQSEVIKEYRKKVYSKMEKYTGFGREYIQRIMREVEKEMKGGAE